MKRLPFIAALAAFVLAAIVFLLTVWGVLAPQELDRRVEWVQLKVQALLPQPPHPEFVPTPLSVDEIETPAPTLPLTTPGVTVPATATRPAPTVTRMPTRISTPAAATALAPRAALDHFRHDYQRFNNCGPTTLSIYLSHFGRSETQYDLAAVLKGTKDDRNVSPDEIVAYAQSVGLHATARVNGDDTEMKRFIGAGIPVMVESWFVPRAQDASGHYRLLTGYDDSGTASTRGVGLTVQYLPDYPAVESGYFIAQDSYVGPNIKLPYQAWDFDWRAFNHTYIVIYTDAQAAAVRQILGDNADDGIMYAQARDAAQRAIAASDGDAYGWFNLGSSLVALGKYDEAARAFDKARLLKLPWRMLWYQFGPYEAYYGAGRYTELIALANATLANSPGLEESLYYRGKAQLALGQKDAARDSFQKAVASNARYAPAQKALAETGN